MKSESFWTFFFIGWGVGGVALAALGGWLFVSHVSDENAASVIGGHDFAVDPFLRNLISPQDITNYDGVVRPPQLDNGYLYEEELPLGFGNWHWFAQVDWRSGERVFEGVYAIKATLIQPGSTFGMSGFSIDTGPYQTLQLMVRPDEKVGDAYIQLYSEKGVAMGEQSLGHYALTGRLIPNEWQPIIIPLQNLLTGGDQPANRVIVGFSIRGEAAGVLGADAIRLSTSSSVHAKWTKPIDAPEIIEPLYDPLATSTPRMLPYALDFDPTQIYAWHRYFGRFLVAPRSMMIGPALGDNTDSLIMLRGGKAWRDYRVDATLDWGETNSFSLLLRMQSDRDYVSCAFSHFGETVQIYKVVSGVSTLIAQTPGLSIPYEIPWEQVHVSGVVHDKQVSCYLNDEKVITAWVAELSPTGTIGLEAWDQNPYASPHHLRTLTVQEIIL